MLIMNNYLLCAFAFWITFSVGMSGCVSPAPRRAARVVSVPADAPPIEAFVNPLPGSRIISYYGSRRRKRHDGVDLRKSVRAGDVVGAARDGVVSMARRRRGYGLTVVIAHLDGSRTRYAHLQKFLVKEGQQVIASQPIGRVGATGRASAPHLHFEIETRNGRLVDPLPYLQPVIQREFGQAVPDTDVAMVTVN
jgi:murein DD-endopeptidase MepM/ murein hydrolase activator NlpD